MLPALLLCGERQHCHCRFWQCPNSKECKYRHALPPGYVLKSQMKELLEAEAGAHLLHIHDLSIASL